MNRKLEDENEFKEIYRFTFNFAKDPGSRNLNFESAKGNKFLKYSRFLYYLSSLGSFVEGKIPILWQMDGIPRGKIE